MSIGNLFSTKSPKKIIETSFGLSGIRIIQEESISVFQFLTKKSHQSKFKLQRSNTLNVSLLSCFYF